MSEMPKLGNRAWPDDPTDAAAEPFDLAELKAWLEQLARRHTAASEQSVGKLALWRRREAKAIAIQLAATREAANSEQALSPAVDTLWRLLAAGIVRYVQTAHTMAKEVQSHHIVDDLATFALWTVVQAAKLPDGWEEELAQITSPRLAEATKQARSRDQAADLQRFARFAAEISAASRYDLGVAHIVMGMTDPRRGGAALTALALAASLPRPKKRRRDYKGAITWVATAITSAALGAEGSAAATAANHLIATISEHGHELSGPSV